VLLLVAACSPVDVPTPTLPVALSVPSVAPEPTPVMAPSVVPASTFVAAGLAPQVDCGGAEASTAIIDYAANAPGDADILSATQGLTGVRPTDVIVVEPTATVVVRDGRPIWRGEWFDGGRGFLLNTATSCPDAGIR
jgi:hypothetical protein